MVPLRVLLQDAVGVGQGLGPVPGPLADPLADPLAGHPKIPADQHQLHTRLLFLILRK